MLKIGKLLQTGTKVAKGFIKSTKKKQTVELYKMFKAYNPNWQTFQIAEKIANLKVAAMCGFSLLGLLEFMVKDQAHPEQDNSPIFAKSATSMLLGVAGYALAGPLGGLAGSSLGYFSQPEFVKKGMKSLNVKS